jgi:O-methyltransferase involved in polyketide biosynthesis
MADDMGIERTVDIADLTYNDEHRADLTDWLSTHGWTATGTPSTEEMRRLNRWIDVPGQEDQDGYSTFVVAQRR